MIRRCTPDDFDVMHFIINDAAQAYKGRIPEDRWTEPYMSADHLRQEQEAGVAFWGYEGEDGLLGVMGIQDVQDVTLVRHAYVRTAAHGKGIGGHLITYLKSHAVRPMLVGTWQAADWAIRFYEKHWFQLVTWEEKERLLRKYWNIPERQTETSVVLADRRWREEG